MRTRKLGLTAAIVLAAVVVAAAEVALDEVVQAGRFVLYRDHADPHKYYYVPDAPRLATKRDGTPEFTFIKYSKTDGATKGGIIHFLVTWGFSEGELASAESALRLKDPQAKIAGPVPFKEGTFKVVSATAGEGGIFNRRIAGEGKAPIMPGQKAAVSIALTEEGASLLWESFKNPTSDISVLFDLKFAGVTPAFQAKLKVNWDKVYTQHDIKLHAEGTIKVVKLQADVRAILEELRQQGAIQLEVVGENQDMQKMLDAVYGHLLTLMCDKVPMGPGEAASPPAKKRPVPLSEGTRPDVPPAPATNAAAGTARPAGEWLRGGPFINQEQAQRAEASPCDDESRQRADSLGRRAAALANDLKYNQAIETYQKAYEACPDPKFLLAVATIQDAHLNLVRAAMESYQKYIERSEALERRGPELEQARRRYETILECKSQFDEGNRLYAVGDYAAAVERFDQANRLVPHGMFLYNLGVCYRKIAEQSRRPEDYERAIDHFRRAIDMEQARHPDAREENFINESRGAIEDLTPQLAAARTSQEARPQAEQAQAAAPATGGQAQQTTSTQPGTKPGAGQTQGAGGQGQQALSSGPGGKTAAQAPGSKPGAKPDAKSAPEIKPIVSVQVGYSFKRVKMSGNYEVDMRKRLREDRDIVMSGNIGGVAQKYGEDARFFSVVSLDDPAFQERSVEVILDGQDAADFKNYINAVSVLFRKQRFSGPPLTGEVKFVDQQFAQSGNRQSFKYGRLNEASTEWLDYEYKPKWSFYGGVEWEGEWAKTSDSVLTLAPPVLRRTIEISVDEDNIVKNNVKALAVQVKHTLYGKDILKEVVINYDKGDPLMADYTYIHEAGKLGYSYKIIWLFLDGREVQTDWLAKESPFVYAVFTKK
ncbi:MAG TPA: tetratricopeptide repeat protein [Acidobacteriota bacterium]|nr:tetratricopeptide repeat protein [Acidobacteriota bacterium]